MNLTARKKAIEALDRLYKENSLALAALAGDVAAINQLKTHGNQRTAPGCSQGSPQG
jgi:hypothetical protein